MRTVKRVLIFSIMLPILSVVGEDEGGVLLRETPIENQQTEFSSKSRPLQSSGWKISNTSRIRLESFTNKPIKVSLSPEEKEAQQVRARIELLKRELAELQANQSR